jgi:hypothetical protein
MVLQNIRMTFQTCYTSPWILYCQNIERQVYKPSYISAISISCKPEPFVLNTRVLQVLQIIMLYVLTSVDESTSSLILLEVKYIEFVELSF